MDRSEWQDQHNIISWPPDLVQFNQTLVDADLGTSTSRMKCKESRIGKTTRSLDSVKICFWRWELKLKSDGFSKSQGPF